MRTPSLFALCAAAGSLAFGGIAHAQAPIDVTRAFNPIVGVAATPGSSTSSISGVGTVAGANNYPAAEEPKLAIDNGLGTKFLNFAKTNVGFIVTLRDDANTTNVAATVTGLRFGAANDAPERDPLLVVIEGTNAADPTTAAGGATWTQIYSGTSGLDTDPGRQAFGPQVNFTNTLAFNTYRVLVTGVRNAGTANSTQFAEVELIGTVIPEPSALGMLAVGAVGFLGSRRRRRA